MAPLALVRDTPSSLPTELTEFVGRRRDRAEVRRLLSESRLVTLTGLGGVGKTRLALRVATELRRVVRDGAWFVPLGELSDPDLIAEAIGAALGLQGRSGRPGVIEHLRTRELLLVLDNCEHLIDDCAILADTLLRTCPQLRILATSREALRIGGEAVWQVAPLAVPDSGGDHGAFHDYESVRLFVELAGQVVPGFGIDDGNRSAVLGICRHLEGIPLALELAAVRLRAMSPAELLERLRGHWELLDLGSRSAPARHRTMQACIEWSHALCSAAERDLWERLSVFPGGVQMDAIEHVSAHGDPSATPDSTAHVVQSLVEKSILSLELHDGRARYRMHEVLRQYGMDRLESAGTLSTTRRVLRDFYAGLLARIDADWMSPRQIDWLRRLRREDANLRSALEFCCTEPGEAATGLELASRLRRYVMSYGAFSEIRQWLHRLLALVPEPDFTRLRGLHAACWLAALQGDRESGSALLDEARRIAARLGASATTLVDQVAGWHQMFLGDFDEAADSLERALDGFEASGELADIADTHTLRGMACGFAGDLERAAASHQASLDISEATGESWCRSYSLWHLGLVVGAGGDPARAVELERESLELKRRMDERLGVALCLEALAWMHAHSRPRRAATLLGAADTLWKVMATSLEALPGLTPLRQSCETSVRAALEPELFEASYGEGAAMDSGAAIAYGLEEKPAAHDAADPPRADLARLTKREHQIAELVAAGLTNQDIASKLVISRRTVETHVEHVLSKLGFTSRTQIAVWISDPAHT
jgi:predicted ATPase/DNA-binding CsgD family transcriptional regulator